MGQHMTDVDLLVASNVKKIAKEKNVSSLVVAEHLKITPQQARNLWRGKHHISAGRLHELSVVLGCTIMEFYLGMEEL